MQCAKTDKLVTTSDGAKITRIDITENRSVGQGNVLAYIRAVSTQSLRNSVPRLHTNGRTCDWLSAKGNARMIYACVYDKAHEIQLHQMSKIIREFGVDSPEALYLKKVLDHCTAAGVVRFEQKLKSEWLRREGLSFWGLFDESALKATHNELITVDDRLQVEAMTLEGIAEKLLRLNIVDTTKAANTTTLYAVQWMNGQIFDASKRQIQLHRSRLRKIGIDICKPCDLSKSSPVLVRKATHIDVKPLAVPDWYELPKTNPLRLIAA
jgi:hypothetical protein